MTILTPNEDNPNKKQNLLKGKRNMPNLSNPKIHELKTSEAKKILNYLSQFPLFPGEDAEAFLEELVSDPKRLTQKSSLTARKAQQVEALNIGDFHTIWHKAKRLLVKENHPYTHAQIADPFTNPPPNHYFLVYTGEGEPPVLYEDEF